MQFRVAVLALCCSLTLEVSAAEKSAREAYDQLTALRVDSATLYEIDPANRFASCSVRFRKLQGHASPAPSTASRPGPSICFWTLSVRSLSCSAKPRRASAVLFTTFGLRTERRAPSLSLSQFRSVRCIT